MSFQCLPKECLKEFLQLLSSSAGLHLLRRMLFTHGLRDFGAGAIRRATTSANVTALQLERTVFLCVYLVKRVCYKMDSSGP